MHSTENIPARPAPAESNAAQSTPSLADQVRAFFSNGRGSVSLNSAQRPTRPGTVRAPLIASGHAPVSTATSSFFAPSGDDSARWQAEVLAIEADIHEDEFFECDAPGM